ncbi:WhiB family transcriptional regulator [Streptomyces collinus]|uniref:WhiB family transcriptional regulator n=1 Tax=Streptomyces collinus TaxID=42684 RepID=UPI003824789B
MTDSTTLRQLWLEHRFFRYRGCAPHPDSPYRMAGDPSLPVGAHHAPDAFFPESQPERKAREAAAIEVCLNCPVMVQCDAYASSVVWVNGMPKVAEPDGVWGGRRSLERHRALVESRPETVAAPDDALRTPQKLAVLRALAVCWDAYAVADAAGLDVRTANWQRSSIVTKLGLPKDVSRMRALAAAAERGLLDGVELVVDDGTVPAVPPPTRMPTPPEPVIETTVEPAASDVSGARPALPEPGPYEPVRVPRPRRDRFTDIDGQLALWETELTDLAPVHDLFPTSNERLETAA